MCSERTYFSVSWKSLIDGVSRQEKDLFHRLSWKRIYPMWLKVQDQKVTMLRFKIMWSLSCVFWMQIGKRIRLKQHYGLLYLDCRFNGEFIYNHIKENIK